MNKDDKLTIVRSGGEGEPIILMLSGDLDVRTAPKLRNFVESVIREGNLDIKLDLSRLSYLDSSGYGALVDANRRTKSTQGNIILTNLPRWMSEFFDMVSLDS
ncbi:MAG TPA: STAS domain-containing protein [bacterium]|jgi:anti-sigma B factor antagonist